MTWKEVGKQAHIQYSCKSFAEFIKILKDITHKYNATVVEFNCKNPQGPFCHVLAPISQGLFHMADEHYIYIDVEDFTKKDVNKNERQLLLRKTWVNNLRQRNYIFNKPDDEYVLLNLENFIKDTKWFHSPRCH